MADKYDNYRKEKPKSAMSINTFTLISSKSASVWIHPYFLSPGHLSHGRTYFPRIREHIPELLNTSGLPYFPACGPWRAWLLRANFLFEGFAFILNMDSKNDFPFRRVGLLSSPRDTASLVWIFLNISNNFTLIPFIPNNALIEQVMGGS